ncbi:serine/threonine-protein kinase [Actinoplanes sp. NBRC 103695]|uniref:serine/threonine-protein kinase n=1 Tax=Actinoplanes sp. NBRC 103695 TaxID=3032202 RepID=UPI00255741C0|nr:serine/threonine-protein kinase [Actinoplanes sp. NBRC 103695]
MSTTDLPGSSLLANRYRLVERLGAGGMSVVWRGFDEVLGRQVAVKVLPPSTSSDSSFRRRLRAEAQAAARLSHPHITNVYDYGEATTVDGEPVPYVVMELVDGESLAAVLARSRRLPWPAAVRIASEVSAALAAAHSRGIVHRDVTPANVMLTPTGAKVVDFGISALIGENDIDPDGSLLGTPAYLAPERLEGGQVSPATDVYAVGLLIYRTLIGQLPWDVGTTTALLRAHQYTEPDPLPPVEGLPLIVSDLVERCLQKRPDDRPSSAELAEILAGAAGNVPVQRNYIPEWADSGEDTTILPSAYPYTDARVRPGHARVADGPAQAGRGVAAVRAAAGPAGLAAAGAMAAAAEENAPISPAPGAPARPVPVAEVEAAVDGAFTAAPPNRGPVQSPGRNNRFGAMPPSTPVAAAPAAPLLPADNSATALRPAIGAPGVPDQDPGGGGNPPPGDRPAGAGSSAPRPRPGRVHGRRVLIVAGTVALLGAVTYSWSLAANDGGRTPPVEGQPQPSVLAASGKCVVSYAVWSEADNRFKASVTVANRDNQAVKNWNLWFIMPGDQVLSSNGRTGFNLDQQERAVTVKGTSTLSPQKAVTLNFSGRYSESNAAPMVFQLGGKTCDAYVSPKPGEPSRPVQRLSNGDVRLGPPASQNPQPGISIGPGGVVVPVPVPTKTGGTKTPTNGNSSAVTTKEPDPTCETDPDLCPGPNPNTPSGGASSPTTTITEEPTKSAPPTLPDDDEGDEQGLGENAGSNQGE